MSDKGEIQQGDRVVETPYTAPPRRTFLGRVGAHYKKWWWLHLIILIIVVLVITLPVVYVGYPRIAQSDVNDSTLNVTDLALLSPTPNSVHANQTQVLGNKAMYHPNLFAFNATIMLVGGLAPISTALVPATVANDGEIINVDTVLNLTNEAAMAQFCTEVLKNDQFLLNFEGRPDLKQGALPTTNVEFNKTVNMTGLNALQGFQILHPRVLLPALPDGTNMNSTLYIPNPSVLTLEMGNITLEVSVNGTHIGQAFLTDLTLRPGNNSLTMNANVNQSYVLNLVTATNAPYKNGIIPLEIVGNSSVASIFHGQVIPYYTAALASNILRTTLNVTEALANAGL